VGVGIFFHSTKVFVEVKIRPPTRIFDTFGEGRQNQLNLRPPQPQTNPTLLIGLADPPPNAILEVIDELATRK
jgi:hypothetical protein